MNRSNIPAWIAAGAAALTLALVFFGGFATKDDLASLEDRIDAAVVAIQSDVAEIRGDIRELRGYFIAHLGRTAPPETPGQ